jgi:hypothetical protein
MAQRISLYHSILICEIWVPMYNFLFFSFRDINIENINLDYCPLFVSGYLIIPPRQTHHVKAETDDEEECGPPDDGISHQIYLHMSVI